MQDIMQENIKISRGIKKYTKKYIKKSLKSNKTHAHIEEMERYFKAGSWITMEATTDSDN